MLKWCMTCSNRRMPGELKAATPVLFALFLCSCLPERFRHEKYDCSASLPNINTIILNKAKTGDYAKIISHSSDLTANISQIDDKSATLKYKNIEMNINRKTGTITMFQGNKYRKVACKKTVFTM